MSLVVTSFYLLLFLPPPQSDVIWLSLWLEPKDKFGTFFFFIAVAPNLRGTEFRASAREIVTVFL